MDGLLKESALGVEHQAHVLIHHVGNIGDHRAHQHIYLQENFEKNVYAHLHVDVIYFALYSVSVEANIPVGKIFQEFYEGRHHVVKFELSLFLSHISDESLEG